MNQNKLSMPLNADGTVVAPGNNTTEFTIWDSAAGSMGKGYIQKVGLERVSFIVGCSGAGTLKSYFKGTNFPADYIQYWEGAVTADDGPWTTGIPTSHDKDWYVGKFDDWKLTWTNTAAVEQSTWWWLLKQYGDRAVTV